MATTNAAPDEKDAEPKEQDQKDYEKMAKILLIDFDNSIIENITPEQENELKIWKDIVKTEEYWSRLIKFEINDDIAKLYFETLPSENKKSYFMFGVACIISFVQANFTGPELTKEVTDYFEAPLFKKIEFAEYLSVNYEKINPNTKLPCLLAAAKIIFKNCKFNPLVNVWWTWRSIIIHQLIMDELCPTLLLECQKVYLEASNLNLKGHVKAKFDIEQAQLWLMYRQVAKAETHITWACELLGLKYELTGKIPREATKSEGKMQLALEVTLLEKGNIQRPPVHKFPVPQNVALNDDVRLDTVSYLDNRKKDMLFPNTEQKLLLTIVQHMMVSKPQHELHYEELKPFLDLILTQNNTWPVRTATLLLRAKLEINQPPTLERCQAQLEEIIKCYRKESPHALTRIGGVYGTCLQPIWKTEMQYADILFKCGKIKQAYDIYLRLDAWDRVVTCYGPMQIDQKTQSNNIRKKYKETKDVRFLCYLGDLTHDVSCYENAWTLSKKRSFRSQRHWGLYLYNQSQHQEAIGHFEKSVSINPLQFEIWLKMGLAAQVCEIWQTAATAFRRYTIHEPNGFECWNNLAQAYIKLGNKRSAHTAFNEGIKCNYDNWKVWENLLVVSADISHFADIIRAYHRLLDLKERYLNTEVLGVLVYGVTNNSNDVEGRPAGHLVQKARGLLGRIVAIYPGEGLIWELYASLAPILVLKAQRLQRAYKAYTSKYDWIKNVMTCQHVMYVCHKLGEVALNPGIDARDSVVQMVRLTLSSAISVVKRQEYEETKKVLQEVTLMLAKLIDKAKTASGKVENK